AKAKARAQPSTFTGVFPVQVLDRGLFAIGANYDINFVLVGDSKKLISRFFCRELINDLAVFINDDLVNFVGGSEEFFRRQCGRSRDREVHVDWDNSCISWVVRINLVHLVTASNEEMIDRGGQAAAFSRNIQWISEGISRAKSN